MNSAFGSSEFLFGQNCGYSTPPLPQLPLSYSKYTCFQTSLLLRSVGGGEEREWGPPNKQTRMLIIPSPPPFFRPTQSPHGIRSCKEQKKYAKLVRSEAATNSPILGVRSTPYSSAEHTVWHMRGGLTDEETKEGVDLCLQYTHTRSHRKEGEVAGGGGLNNWFSPPSPTIHRGKEAIQHSGVTMERKKVY